MGALGIDPGTSGSIAFDDFEARRFSYIGPLPDPGIPDPEPVAEPSWLMASYNYAGVQPHAVTSVAREQADSTIITDTYQYDANGNMTCRVEGGVTFVQEYNAENRIAQVRQVDGDCTDAFTANDSQVWSFTYDGDGVRVMEVFSITNGTAQVPQSTKHYFAGGSYEVEVDHTDADAVSTKKYYSIAGMRVAMDDGTDLVYFASDHLSSTSIVMDASGNLLSDQRYLPFGEVRADVGTLITETDFGYTGQRNLGDMGLMGYNARFYSPLLGRFIQPDTIVPNPGDSQAWNRYSYVGNNPVIYIDPDGHTPFIPILFAIGFFLTLIAIPKSLHDIEMGAMAMAQISKEPEFRTEQKEIKQYWDNCMGRCHYPDFVDPAPGVPIGGPIPETPLSDMYYAGMAQTGQGIVGFFGGIAYMLNLRGLGKQMNQNLLDEIDPITMSDHAADPEYLIKRGWTEEEALDVVNNPVDSYQSAQNTRPNDGSSTVTIYEGIGNDYVAVNDTTREIIGLNKRSDPFWKKPQRWIDFIEGK